MRPPKRASRVGAMGRRVRIPVVVRMPEKTVVVRRLVAGSVIDVDVDDVPRQFPHHRPPSHVTRPKKLKGKSGYRVVLIVVVRDEDAGAGVPHAFMVPIDLAKVSPAIFVDAL